jgi:transposase InsO family protein
MVIKESLESGSRISVDRATRLLGVSRCGFYKWQGQSEEDQIKGKEMDVRNELQKIAVEFPTYGYRRITAELRNRGYTVNHKRVLRLMREDNLLCVRKRFKPRTTDSDHNLRRYPNLIKDLEITRLNQVWASDITYIRLHREFVYLAVVLDLFSRRCIGWNLDRSLYTELALSALTMALEERGNEKMPGLIHHSDQGVQYASNEYIECLEAHGIRISMAARGNPYDNAFVESFIRTLKYEEVYLNGYENFSDALENIPSFIDDIYNKKRLRSSLGYRSPIDFEKEVYLNSSIS